LLGRAEVQPPRVPMAESTHRLLEEAVSRATVSASVTHASG
jgi:hypothetical protein